MPVMGGLFRPVNEHRTEPQFKDATLDSVDKLSMAPETRDGLRKQLTEQANFDRALAQMKAPERDVVHSPPQRFEVRADLHNVYAEGYRTEIAKGECIKVTATQKISENSQSVTKRIGPVPAEYFEPKDWKTMPAGSPCIVFVDRSKPGTDLYTIGICAGFKGSLDLQIGKQSYRIDCGQAPAKRAD